MLQMSRGSVWPGCLHAKALCVCVLVLFVLPWCCSWDMQQPPRDNNPSMRLYRHTQNITGLAQITDERLVSGSMDGSVGAGCWL